MKCGWFSTNVLVYSLFVWVFVCMFVYLCVSLCVFARMCIFLGVFASLRIYICIFVLVSVHAYICASVFTYVYICSCVRKSIFVSVCLHTFVCITVYLCKCASVHAYIYTCLYTCLCILASTHPCAGFCVCFSVCFCVFVCCHPLLPASADVWKEQLGDLFAEIKVWAGVSYQYSGILSYENIIFQSRHSLSSPWNTFKNKNNKKKSTCLSTCRIFTFFTGMEICACLCLAHLRPKSSGLINVTHFTVCKLSGWQGWVPNMTGSGVLYHNFSLFLKGIARRLVAGA